ncbi:MAG: hypothetical protein FWC48_03680, partial [Actinomycetia bacterium]|nr:hypothetical protein [Actinomycetes bacterium]
MTNADARARTRAGAGRRLTTPRPSKSSKTTNKRRQVAVTTRDFDRMSSAIEKEAGLQLKPAPEKKTAQQRRPRARSSARRVPRQGRSDAQQLVERKRQLREERRRQ